MEEFNFVTLRLRKAAKISIVVPTYNSAATIIDTLESIRDQQWPNTEVIIIDGASKDRTVELAKSFVGHGLIVVSEPDNGIYDAINKGIACASGDLIGVIGSDDRLVAGAFCAISDTWNDNRSDIIAGEALLVSQDGTTSKRTDEAYGLGVLISGIPFCHNSMYVTPETYKKIGMYSLNYQICADAEWVHRSVRAGCTCTRIERPLVYFGLGGTSSNNDELIMAETYAVIAANFPGLSINDAEILFKAVRGWTDDTLVAGVLEKHLSNSSLHEAVANGLHYSSTKTKSGRRLVSWCEKNIFSVKVLRKICGLFGAHISGN